MALLLPVAQVTDEEDLQSSEAAAASDLEVDFAEVRDLTFSQQFAHPPLRFQNRFALETSRTDAGAAMQGLTRATFLYYPDTLSDQWVMVPAPPFPLSH